MKEQCGERRKEVEVKEKNKIKVKAHIKERKSG
jgi:hypothetical protein